MALEADFVAALEPLARAFERYAVETGHPAVLVGGAATALYTDGAFASGDFDVVASLTSAFDEAMVAEGFCREDRAGHLHVGYFHPDHPRFGFQQVSGRLFDGLSDVERLSRITVTTTEAGVTVPSIEDMIADRLAQHAVASPTDTSRLRQAQGLLKLAGEIDIEYLRQRIRDEGGDPALLDLKPEYRSRP